MNTKPTLLINSISSDATEQFGERLGKNLNGGETIELNSDLGGGKTTFVRGLARGAGSSDRVASPTFTISKLYEGPKFNIIHFDFYRLRDAGIVANELAEAAADADDVVVVEWGDIVEDVLPPERLTVNIIQKEDGSRNLEFLFPEKLAYLTEGLQ